MAGGTVNLVKALRKGLLAVPAAAGLYLMAIRPAAGGRTDDTPLQGHFFAHRGLHDNKTDAPENSMKAFAKACEAGYGIELDIQLSKDGIPVVFHDGTLDRACGRPGAVSSFTYEELHGMKLFGSEETIPSFRDVLALVDGRVPLIVEYKSEDRDMRICEIADPMLQAYKGVYCIESFNPLILLWYRKHRPGVMRGQLSDGYMQDAQYRRLPGLPLYFSCEYLLFNFLTQPDFIAYNDAYRNNLSRRLCRKLYRNPAVVWTIKSREQLRDAEDHFDVFIFEGFEPDRGGASPQSIR